MNHLSLTGAMFDGLKNWILGLFDNIPKAIYFFVACFNCAIDALQCLIRKLAGLDVYYVKGTSEWSEHVGSWGGKENEWNNALGYTGTNKYTNGLNPVRNKDPLSEFVYGILGIGNNATAYKALNTVFWSLSIFALILLLLSTMVAVIKSHYSEDYQNTNPWKYVYTAIKAVLTYAIMPVVVVVGMMLTSFILKTLDDITAGTDEGKITAIYGSSVVTNCFDYDTIDGEKAYSQFDLFGEGNATTSTTFGGMLFQAAAYSANRVRSSPSSGGISIDQAQSLKVANTSIFGNSESKNWVDAGNNVTAQRDAVAYQIDYAFMNNFRLKETVAVSTLASTFKDVRFISVTNLVGGWGFAGLEGFSKFNITAVWFFYDLWNFNFIVAFGGAVTVIGIMLSIIIGLMSRLIKGAALFILYPPLLALAPLDSFKAFKDWGKSFMGNILMAFGAIIGMNLMLLILPYVQEIKWFGDGFALLDSIVNMIILIVGLCMVKDFIQLVSGFIGGDNAVTSGDGLKASVASTIRNGSTKALATGASIARANVKMGIKAAANIHRVGKAAQLKYFHNHQNDNGKRKGVKVRAQKSGIVNADGHVYGGVEQNIDNMQAILQNMGSLHQEADGTWKVTEGRGAKDLAGGNKRREAAMQAGLDAKRTYLNEHLGEADAEEKANYEMRKAMRATMETTKGTAGSGKSWAEELEAHEKSTLERLGDSSFKGWRQQRAIKKYNRLEKHEQQAKFEGKWNIVGKDGEISAGAAIKNPIREMWAGDGKEKGGIKGMLKGLGETFKNELDPGGLGKVMADGFLKTMKSMISGTGLDKMTQAIKTEMQQALTFKGGVTNPVLQGDALERRTAAEARENARVQKSATDETNRLLKSLIEKTEAQGNAIDKLSKGPYRSGGGGS